MKSLQQQVAAIKKSLGAAANLKVTGAKTVSIVSLDGIVIDNTKAVLKGQWNRSTSNPRFVAAGYLYAGWFRQQSGIGHVHNEIAADGKYEVRISYSPGGNRASNTPITVWSADGSKTVRVNQKQKPLIDGLFVSLGTFTFRRDEPARVVVDNTDANAIVIADAIQFLSVKPSTQSAVNKPATDAKPNSQPVKEDPKTDVSKQKQVAAKRAKLKILEGNLKQAQTAITPRDLTMSVVEEAEIGNTHIHIRGIVHNLGSEVPRGFLQVVSTGPAAKFTDRESGRRQMGQWLAGDTNPLTARVTVNRMWHWLFGVGLVRTTDNFGTGGEKPSHPELLDHIAARFQRDGWSVKSLLRRMVLSRTYRMSSRTTEPLRAITSTAAAVDAKSTGDMDVENRLLWRMNRHRLEAESIRDTMLAVSGKLDLKMHGPTFPSKLKEDYDFHYVGLRRSVYAPIFRNSLPELFEVFDFANSSIVVGSRSVSTVASQALFMMNNPFVIEQSQHAAERLWKELPTANDAMRIERAYRSALGRRPTAAEIKLAQQFVGSADETTRIEIWGELYQVLFASLDFRYVD